MFGDIPGSASWTETERINKGWSDDVKYRVRTREGDGLLLRLSDIAQFEAKRKEYEIIGKYAALGFPMSRPVAFGLCGQGQRVYMLLTWVEGEDLEAALPGLPGREQYLLGREAGRILRQIHSIPVDAADLPAQTKRAKKLTQLARYEASRVRIPHDGDIIAFVRDGIGRIGRQPPVYQHGDYHPGNLIYTPEGRVGVIDFNRWEVGDPFEEFYKLQSFGTELSVPYCIGQIDAYFGDSVPSEFWETLAVYVAHASLSSIKWAERFGQADVEGMTVRCLRALEDYDRFRRSVPKWYTDSYRREFSGWK